MAYSIAIIGSFRREENYSLVQDLVKYFKINGLAVLSPSGKAITNSIEKFVIFETDDKDMNPEEIQMITLEKIMKADVVYVCNKNGYIGKTTCYEIGFCYSRGKPIYFMEKPEDLPLQVSGDNVVDKEKMLTIALQNKERKLKFYSEKMVAQNAEKNLFPEKSHVVEEKIVKNILICGSMQFYKEMKLYQKKINEMGYMCEIPRDEGDLPDNITEEEFFEFKRRVSNAYLKKIRDKSTAAILVFNTRKSNKDNYIGANTFVELAMAYTWGRKIYLLNDMYEPYIDELKAWKVIPLKGNINYMLEDMKNTAYISQDSDYTQMTIDDVLGKNNECE